MIEMLNRNEPLLHSQQVREVSLSLIVVMIIMQQLDGNTLAVNQSITAI